MPSREFTRASNPIDAEPRSLPEARSAEGFTRVPDRPVVSLSRQRLHRRNRASLRRPHAPHPKTAQAREWATPERPEPGAEATGAGVAAFRLPAPSAAAALEARAHPSTPSAARAPVPPLRRFSAWVPCDCEAFCLRPSASIFNPAAPPGGGPVAARASAP